MIVALGLSGKRYARPFKLLNSYLSLVNVGVRLNKVDPEMEGK